MGILPSGQPITLLFLRCDSDGSGKLIFVAVGFCANPVEAAIEMERAKSVTRCLFIISCLKLQSYLLVNKFPCFWLCPVQICFGKRSQASPLNTSHQLIGASGEESWE
jgi:hypothetical protein